MKPYLMDRERVLDELKTSAQGLTAQEARQRLEEAGPNRLAEGKKETLLRRFLKQLADPMIIVLLAAAAISGVTSMLEENGSLVDALIILFVVVLNAVLGVIQESKAEEAIAALKTMTAATSKVVRDGKMHAVKSE